MANSKIEGIKAVFFDAGHTLIYTYPSVGVVYSRELKRFGADVDPQLLEKSFLDVFRDFTNRFSKEADSRIGSDEHDRRMWREITTIVYNDIPAMQTVDFDKWFEAVYDAFGRADAWRFYDDVIDTLTKLRNRGLCLGIISNWDSRLKNIVRGLGLDKLVDFVLISAEVGVRKPDPSIFERALKLSKVIADQAIHIGDLYEEDVLGAQSVGIKGILIDRRNMYKEPKGDGVLVIKDLREFANLLA